MNGVLGNYFVVFHREFDNKMSRRRNTHSARHFKFAYEICFTVRILYINTVLSSRGFGTSSAVKIACGSPRSRRG